MNKLKKWASSIIICFPLASELYALSVLAWFYHINLRHRYFCIKSLNASAERSVPGSRLWFVTNLKKWSLFHYSLFSTGAWIMPRQYWQILPDHINSVLLFDFSLFLVSLFSFLISLISISRFCSIRKKSFAKPYRMAQTQSRKVYQHYELNFQKLAVTNNVMWIWVAYSICFSTNWTSSAT